MANEFLLDNWTDANGTNPTAHTPDSGGTWTSLSGFYTGSADINTNRLRNTGPTDSTGNYGLRHSVLPSDQDHWIEVDWYIDSSNTRPFAFMLRAHPTDQTWYWVYGVAASGIMQIWQMSNGSLTQLGSDIAQTWTVGQTYTVRGRVYGTGATVTLEIQVNGGSVITRTDSSGTRITANGYAGIYLGGGTGVRADRIRGEDISSADSVSLSDIASGKVYQRSGTSASVTITGSYVGTVTSIEARIVQAGTSTEVVTWTEIDASPSAGSFSGVLSVPQGGAYNVQVRAGNNTSLTSNGANSFFVGAIVGVTGQSNALQMFSIGSDSPASNTRKYSGSWATNTGAGSIALANALATALGVPIGMVDTGINASSLTPEGDRGFGVWLDTGDTPYTNWQTFTTAIGGKYEALVWIQGEADGFQAVAGATYRAGLETLFGRFRTYTSQASLPITLTTLARTTHPDADDVAWQTISDTQLGAETITAVKVIGGTKLLGLADEAHYDATGYQTLGGMIARGVRASLGESVEYKGPDITGASFISSTVIDVAITHRAGSDFTPTSGITGFSVLDGGTPVTISSVARQSANTIRITLAAPLVGAGTVRYLYGMNPTISSAIKDNSANTFALEQKSAQAVAPASLVLGSGSFAVTGGAMTFGARVPLAAGSFAMTGGNLDFVYTPPPETDLTMDLGAGSFAMTGGQMIFILTEGETVTYDQRPPMSRVIIVRP